MIYSDEHLERLSTGWTPSEVREVIRQYRLALRTLDALQAFVPPRKTEQDVQTIVNVIDGWSLAEVSPRKLARKILRALALPNSEVHVSIKHFRDEVGSAQATVNGKQICVTPNGRTDSHGKFIKMVCAFCGGTPHPRSREEDLQDEGRRPQLEDPAEQPGARRQ